jgi:tetratricopeptide (TPR) repeat protein
MSEFLQLIKLSKLVKDSDLSKVFQEQMRVMIKIGEYKQVIELYDLMSNLNIPKTGLCYEQMIKAHEQLGHWDEIIKLAQLMNDEKIKKTKDIYSILLQAYAKLERIDALRNTFNEYFKHYPEHYSYDSLFIACKKGFSKDTVRLADELFRDMKNKNFAPSLISYNLLIDLHVSCGNYSRASELIKEAVVAKKYKSNLGLKINKNGTGFNLHVDAVYTSDEARNYMLTHNFDLQHPPGVSLGLAQAILTYFLEHTTPEEQKELDINPKSFKVIVGKRGDNILKQGIAGFLSNKGYSCEISHKGGAIKVVKIPVQPVPLSQCAIF